MEKSILEIFISVALVLIGKLIFDLIDYSWGKYLFAFLFGGFMLIFESYRNQDENCKMNFFQFMMATFFK